MSEIITIQAFPPFNFLQETELTSDIVEGATSLPVKNESGFDTDHAILLGSPGAEGSEIVTPSNVADEDITVGATDQSHKAGTKVYMLRGNKARVYAASNVDGTQPTTDTYSLLGAVTLTGDVKEPEYEHVGGGSDYWYLYTFYNDIPGSPTETSKVLTDAIRGGGYGRYATVDEVRAEAGLSRNKWIKDAFVYEKLVMSESEVNGSLVLAGYSLPLDTVPANVKNATILLAAGYVLTTDYGPEHSGTNKDGEARIARARKILAGIESGKTPLVDAQGAQITTGAQMSGYPDDTAEDESPSEARIFSITDEF